MGLYPNFSGINKEIASKLRSRKDSNIFMSGKMAWIRVASPLDGGLVLETFSSGSSFASNYGNVEKSGKIGVKFNGDAVFADNDRAYRPSPNIDNIEVDTGNMGLTRKAKFNIICYTLKQAELLSEYFLEPGYSVLIEYGWNNIASLTERADWNKDDNSPACVFASYNNYKIIKDKRDNSNGDYDGFMGYITDSTFTSADGEIYILDVEVTALGEIPSYLQVHRSNVDATTGVQSSIPYGIDEIEDDADDEFKYGISLFKQTFNKLPGAKQTDEIRDLIDSSKVDTNGRPWISPENFINVDEKTRTQIIAAVSKLDLKEETVTIPSGNIIGDFGQNIVDFFSEKALIPDASNLITDESYIRLELAWEIINNFNLNLKPYKTKLCKNCETYDYIININDTIIRAHPWMFSVDGSKLYIPNRKLPNFGLDKLQLVDTKSKKNVFLDIDTLGSEGSVLDGCQWDTFSGEFYKPNYPKEYAFPSQTELKLPKNNEIGSAEVNQNAGEWGYLRNLYINLNFFRSVLQRSNYVAKDIVYELLNGLSSAANSYWNFELFETCKTKSDDSTKESPRYMLHMAVRDTSFTGKIDSKQINMDNLLVNGVTVPIYDASGIDSPFLTSNINITMPAAKRNQILAKRNSTLQDDGKINTQIDDQTIEDTRVYSTKSDPVLELLNSFNDEKHQQEEELKTQEDKAKLAENDRIQREGSDEERKKLNNEIAAAKEIATEKNNQLKADKKNYENDRVDNNVAFFKSHATIVPLTRARNTADEFTNMLGVSEYLGLEKLVIVGAWNDTTLLKRIELQHYNTNKNKNGQNKISTGALIGIEFTFETIGISALSVGDLFSVRGLPKQFNNAIFQIFTVTHNLSNGFWKTSVTAKQRNTP